MAILNKMDQQIEVWRSDNDDRQYFLRCYRVMTFNMLTAIAQNKFDDPVWIDRLLHCFADYYFDAHEKTSAHTLHRIQYLLLGVNAHINYDLVLTLRDMLESEWPNLSERQKQQRHSDHCRVNDIIGASIDQVQDEILEPGSPWLQIMDRLMGRVDEYLVSRLITQWRQSVWEHSLQMLATTESNEREVFRQNLEAEVLQRGRRIIGFG